VPIKTISEAKAQEQHEAARITRPDEAPEAGGEPDTATRREALRIGLAATVGWTWTACSAQEGRVDESPRAGGPGDEAYDEAYDEALRRLHGQEPESRQGLSTHAPMVAEALCALGHGDRAVAWIEEDDAPIRRLPSPSSRIEREQWRAALGPRLGTTTWEAANARWGDWKEFFLAELSERRWQDVLDLWLARLAPGMCGAATHGVIRTAHAVRALARRETAERRGELARGLAYWASSYEELPARRRSGPRAETFTRALVALPRYWETFGKAPAGRNIVEALRHVRELEGFAEARDLIAEPVDLTATLSSLTATFTSVYLEHGRKHDTIAFVHAVTGPCSLRRLAPHVKPETARAALPYAWQAAAAIYAAYARGVGDERPKQESTLSRGELVARAVESGDEHAIKFTEVMLAEYALNPAPVYLAAAEDAIARL
jgi:hypothetical protein